MALGNGIPPELAALLGAGQPTGGGDPRTAMIEALQNAMGKRSLAGAQMMPMQAAPATDSEIGNAVGGAIDMMTPRGQQPNYNYTGQDPYVKFPEGGVPEPYRPDSDMNPEPPNFRSEKYAQRDTGSQIDAGESSYDRSPGEDKAAAMAQDAVEGKGTMYPGKSGNDMLRDATRRGGGDPNGDWEGSPDGVPTKGDLEAVQESPTDGNLASFFRAFPKYTMEDVMMRGGNPSGSPDEYAMSDEDFQRLNRRRRTTIENR